MASLTPGKRSETSSSPHLTDALLAYPASEKCSGSEERQMGRVKQSLVNSIIVNVLKLSSVNGYVNKRLSDAKSSMGSQ